MLMALHEIAGMVRQNPLPTGVAEAMIESTGVKRGASEDNCDFEARFEEMMGESVDEYLATAVQFVINRLADARNSVKYALKNEPKSLEPGAAGSAFDDFQHRIHSGPEQKVAALTRFLPGDNSCKQELLSAKEKYHDAATYFIHPERASETGVDLDEDMSQLLS